MQIFNKYRLSKKDASRIRKIRESDEESHLWKAVICQAIEDATSNSTQKRKLLAKKRALKWLLEDNDDFKTVCELAGYRPKQVKAGVEELMT